MADIGEDSPDGSGSRTNLQSDSITIDPSHELYLYPSDNPSNALVSNLLDVQNYGHWRKTIEIALIAKNKIGFVRGTYKKPNLDSPLANQWERRDKMIISWLINSVIKTISDSVLFSNSSAHIWKQLELRYGQVDRTKIFQIQRDLCSISQGNMSIVDYYIRLKLLWDDYNSLIIIPPCSCGEKYQTYASVQHLIHD